MGTFLQRLSLKLKPFRRRITYSERFVDFLAALGFFVITLYARTLKIRYVFHPDFLALDRTKVCFGFWHGRQFLLVPGFGRWNVCLMTDVSWAGEIQTRIMARFGYTVVRGSSKRKGVQALLNMKRAMEQGTSGAFALDGPRGPIHRSKPGIVFLAQKLGYPIIPVATTADRAWVFRNTWCRYLLPKPFSRCIVAFGQPVWADGLATEALDRILAAWTVRTDRKVGRLPDGPDA